MLCVQTARLLLNGTERAGHGNCCQLTLGILGRVHIGRQLNAVAVAESNFLVVNLITLGERLVPLLCQLQCSHIIVCFCLSVTCAAREH